MEREECRKKLFELRVAVATEVDTLKKEQLLKEVEKVRSQLKEISLCEALEKQKGRRLK